TRHENNHDKGAASADLTGRLELEGWVARAAVQAAFIRMENKRISSSAHTPEPAQQGGDADRTEVLRRTHACTRTHTQVQTNTHKTTHTQRCTHTRTHTHTHTHTRTHTRANKHTHTTPIHSTKHISQHRQQHCDSVYTQRPALYTALQQQCQKQHHTHTH